MKKSLVKARWAAGEAATCAILHLADGAYAEFAAAQPCFDCIWYDLEHGPVALERAADLFRAVRWQGKDVMARPGKGEFMRMGRMLEQGASGIMYPRCENVDEAREFVRWAKFAPLGERGFAGDNAEAGYGAIDVDAYVTAANAETFLAPMIESPTSLANARAIAETEGVDMLFFGPGDYSVLGGIRSSLDSLEILKAMEQACVAARAAGKHFGSLAITDEQMRRLVDMGADFLMCYSDMAAIADSFALADQRIRQITVKNGQKRHVMDL